MKPLDLLSEDEFAQLVQRAARLPDAPPALLRAAIDQWEAAQPSMLQTARAVLKRLVAELTFDSWAGGPLAFGMRTTPSDTRHLLYTAMGRDIDLRVTRTGGLFALTGQVLGPDESGDIELAPEAGDGGEAAGALRTSLDALGEFRFEGIRGGSYVLTLRLGESEILLPPIDVDESRR